MIIIEHYDMYKYFSQFLKKHDERQLERPRIKITFWNPGFSLKSHFYMGMEFQALWECTNKWYSNNTKETFLNHAYSKMN